MAYISFQPKDYFNTKLYTGTGSSNAITGINFRPDFTWIKSRSNTYSHTLTDAVRGVTKHSSTNNTNAEYTSTTEITSFDSDGFTVGTDAGVNNSGSTFVSWNWLANGQGSSNTDGSINTTYTSANTTSGFSISTYTGTNQSSGTATVGHGLGVIPSVVISKKISGTQNWNVYHASVGNGSALRLNLDDSKNTQTDFWGDTTPSSSVVTLGPNNLSSGTHILYCFAEKKGFSKFGSYSSNNNTDGPFIYTGFSPAFVIIKSYNTAVRNWTIQDNKRSSSGGPNPNDKWLYTNSNEEEANQASNPMDFLSNGFKLRNTGSYQNQSEYIYMAFASEPLVSSNGVAAVAK